MGYAFTAQARLNPAVSVVCAGLLQYGNSVLYPVPEKARLPQRLLTTDDKQLQIGPMLSSGRVAVISKIANRAGKIAKVAREEKYAPEITAEYELYRVHAAQLKGRVIPIDEVLNTASHGPVLVKPEVSGQNLNRILMSGEFTAEQRAALGEMVNWSKAFRQATNLQIDINPFNLGWVEDPRVLARLGLSKPSFVLYEFSVGGSGLQNGMYYRLYDLVTTPPQ